MTKILVISHNSFSNKMNNGKTLESLFHFYPKNNLAQLFFSQNEIPDFDFCDNYYKITDTDVLKNIFSVRKKYGQALKNEQVLLKKNPNFISFLFNRFWRLTKSISSYIIIFRDWLWKSGSWKTNDLYSWIEDFNPNVLFFCGGNSGFSHDVSVHLHTKYNIPLITFFTDDYLLNPINRNFIDWLQRKRMRKFYSKTVRNSSLLFVISDLMATAYSNHFNKGFSSIMNSVSNSDYERLYLHKSINSNIRIGYFGGLHLGRWKMISKLSNIINKIGKNCKLEITVEVFTNSVLSTEISRTFKADNIIINKPVQGLELIKNLINFDFLLHVESDENYYQSLTKLSISTKIPEYLFSKNCIIAYGPKELASLRILWENEIGLVIDNSENEESIAKKLSDVFLNPKQRSELGLKGYNFALKNFNLEASRKLFMQKLNDVVNQYN